MILLASCFFVLLALVGPGFGLQRALRLRPDVALVLPIGLLSCAFAYSSSLLLGEPGLFPWAMAAANACNLLGLIGMGERAESRAGVRPELRGDTSTSGGVGRGQDGCRLSDISGALWPWLVFVALLLPTQFPWNRPAADGTFLLDPIAPYDDAVFHVGLARELTLGLPPQVPGLSGVTLGYHLGQGLVRAAALRFASLSPFDLISRVDPVVLSLGLILLLRSLAARLGLPPLGVALAGWSVLFTDFSFVFAGNASATYWADLLKGNLLLSLAYVNPVVPGLILALGALLALARFESGEGRAWLGLGAVQAAALPHFKVFLGAHLVLGLAVAAAFSWRDRRALGALAVVAVPCAVTTCLLALGQGGAAVSVTLAPFDLAQVTRQSLDLPAAHGLAFAGWCVFWLVASLGLRWLGAGHALAAMRTGARAGAALAAMALTAWPLGLAFRIAVTDALPGQKVVNDAAYIVEQGGPLLWIFTAAALASLAARRSRVAALSLVALAVPSTIQFVVHKAGSLPIPAAVQFIVPKADSPPDRLPAPMLRAVAALRAVAQPGDVVLQRPGARYPPAPVLLANLRVPYERYTPFRTQFASKEFLERRHEQVFRFFRTEDPEEARAISRDLGASYLALYGPDRVRFDPTGVLEPILEEEGARVFRIRPALP